MILSLRFSQGSFLSPFIHFLLNCDCLCGDTFLSRSDYVLDYFHSHFVLFYQLGYSVEGECWMLCTPEVPALVYTSVPRHSLFSLNSAAIISNRIHATNSMAPTGAEAEDGSRG
jgi:hypothetical protein